MQIFQAIIDAFTTTGSLILGGGLAAYEVLFLCHKMLETFSNQHDSGSLVVVVSG